MQTARFIIRNNYGTPTIYPLCAVSETFAALIKRKTFDRSHLDLIKSLGYQVEIINAQAPFHPVTVTL